MGHTLAMDASLGGTRRSNWGPLHIRPKGAISGSSVDPGKTFRTESPQATVWIMDRLRVSSPVN